MTPLRSTALALLLAGVAVTTVSAQAANDYKIVPGVRIGPVNLGMTAAQIYAAKGEPKSSMSYTDGHFSYDWGDISVQSDKAGHVVVINPGNGAYTTPDGLQIGSSELALQAKRPNPAWVKAPLPEHNDYCFDDGLGVNTYQGRITGMTVWSVGCGFRGHYTCYTQRGNMTYVGNCRKDG